MSNPETMAMERAVRTPASEGRTTGDHDYATSISVDRTPQEAFLAINNPGEWWGRVEGSTDKLGGVFTYHYEDVARYKIEVAELIPAKKVVWHVLDSYMDFVGDKNEWKDTRIVFEISKKGTKTEVRFTHLGLVPQFECYEACSDAWGSYIGGSLLNLVRTGKGEPDR